MQINKQKMNDSSLPTVKKLLENKLATLERKLNASIHQKQVLELKINSEFEKIKKMRASLEKLDAVCNE